MVKKLTKGKAWSLKIQNISTRSKIWVQADKYLMKAENQSYQCWYSIEKQAEQGQKNSTSDFRTNNFHQNFTPIIWELGCKQHQGNIHKDKEHVSRHSAGAWHEFYHLSIAIWWRPVLKNNGCWISPTPSETSLEEELAAMISPHFAGFTSLRRG